MTKRIFRSILLVTVSSLLLSSFLIMSVLYASFSSEQKKQRGAVLALAAHGVETGGTGWLTEFTPDGYRLTLISADGAVRFDSAADASSMQNHLDREEIQQALQTGSGESTRLSYTLTQNTVYQALLLQTGDVLRISVTQSSILALLCNTLAPALIVLAVALLLSAWLAKRIAAQATAPLNALDLEHPLDNEIYDELSPLLVRLAHQQRQIEKQLFELQRRQNELATITKNMNEGLVLLNDKRRIISINPAAQALFSTDASCMGLDFLTVERSSQIQRMIDAAMASGHSEMVLHRNGRQYEIDASRILSGENAAGTAILTFDVTEKATAEQQRREFTANVSHELKTPLQSIMGSAELVENGLVAKQDMPRFVGNIRTEAGRLVTLIDDIIRLSQLDEGSELPRENVDLYAIAQEVCASLCDAACRKQVSLSVSGEKAVFFGVKRLLHEIVYNLTDNAIRYNRENGTVHITVTSDEKNVILVVEDTGIGIPLTHQSRIFERFYRVDKSHSKATGGTGLGLSIVKHAVLAQHGSIRLDSTVDCGTKITVTLPK